MDKPFLERDAGMKQRTFLWALMSFLVGMGVAYGLVRLDRKAMVPRLERTQIFEVVTSGGAVLRLSYAEIEREREELRDLRLRLEEIERNVLRPGRRGEGPPVPPPAAQPAETASPERAKAKGDKPPDRNMKDLFAKIFSRPVMEELALAQIAREAGELADVLDLTDEQMATLEEELRKRKKNLPLGMNGSPSARTGEEVPQRTLQEELQKILTPEQYRKYQEYTEKKNALIGAPALDREVFELNWRLKLSAEQETPVREILREQERKMAQLLPAAAMDLEADASPAEGLEKHLQQRTALNRETADRMKNVLDEDQYEVFLRYQVERDTETRLLRRLIREERAGEAPAATP